MKLKIWYILSIAVTITYFILGVIYLGEGKFHFVGFGMLITATIALAGIFSFTMKNFIAAKTLFIISGILGLPIGVLLIVFAVLIDKLPDEN